MVRINVGCGKTPIKGWRNFDNSISLKLSKLPYLVLIGLKILHIINKEQFEFIQVVRDNDIEFGDVVKGLPLENSEVDVLYSCHMLEHLDREEADIFFIEAFRILRSGGKIRVLVPEIKKKIDQYCFSRDADAFIVSTLLTVPRPKSIMDRFKKVLVGSRNHNWMYDGVSLSKLFKKHGFEDIKICKPGQTSIKNHNPLNLFDRSEESVCVEAKKPNKKIRDE